MHKAPIVPSVNIKHGRHQSNHLPQPPFLSAPANLLSSFSQFCLTIFLLTPNALTNLHASISPRFHIPPASLLLTPSTLVAATARRALASTRSSVSRRL